MSIILNFRILAELEKNGKRTSSALYRILDIAKIRVDQALKKMHQNGLVEKLEPSKDHNHPHTHDKDNKPVFQVTNKGNFALQSVNSAYTIIQASLHGNFSLKRFQNTREKKRDRMFY